MKIGILGLQCCRDFTLKSAPLRDKDQMSDLSRNNILLEHLGLWKVKPDFFSNAPTLSRRILSSLNWGTLATGELWLNASIHSICAETIVKGHLAQCKNTNSLIAKSINKVAKLASKLPDYEQQFNFFCWDILFRLKLSPEVSYAEVIFGGT